MEAASKVSTPDKKPIAQAIGLFVYPESSTRGPPLAIPSCRTHTRPAFTSPNVPFFRFFFQTFPVNHKFLGSSLTISQDSCEVNTKITRFLYFWLTKPGKCRTLCLRMSKKVGRDAMWDLASSCVSGGRSWASAGRNWRTSWG